SGRRTCRADGRVGGSAVCAGAAENAINTCCVKGDASIAPTMAAFALVHPCGAVFCAESWRAYSAIDLCAAAHQRCVRARLSLAAGLARAAAVDRGERHWL